MHEKCKEAAKMIEEIKANISRLPFTLRPSEKLVPTMKSDPVMGVRSPLTMNDNNMHFLSQAKIAGCREAMQANPLRNISGNLFQLCRNAGMDLVELSQRVQRKTEVEREKEMLLSQNVEISSSNVNVVMKTTEQASQTQPFFCPTCDERDRPDAETGIFTARLDERTVENLSREQNQALVEFCRAFNIRDDRFKPTKQRSQWDSDDEEQRQQPPAQNDERRFFANPSPPDTDNGFINLSSPLRRSTRSRSRSGSPFQPKRRRITDRLGAKIPSPRMPRFRDDEDRLLNPTAPYRIPTPPMRAERSYSKLSQPNGYRNRSESRSLSPPRQVHYREKRSRTPDRAQRRGRY